jgi:SLT domain-containing protein
VLITALGLIVIIGGATGLGGIIAATFLVALAVGAFAKKWKHDWAEIKHWGEDAWNFLTHGWGQLLVPGLTIIRDVIELVRDHWKQAWDIIKNWARDVWNFLIHGIGQLLVPQIKAIWTIVDIVATHWQQAWGQIKSVASTVWNFLYNNVLRPWAHYLLNDIPNAFRTAVSVIGRVWGTLENIFKGPVSFLVNTVYDNGIARLWNDVMNKVGGPTLPTLHFASGGRVPGWGGGDIQPALLEPGETVVSKEHSRALAGVFAAAGVPGYQLGGIIGGAKHLLGDLFGGLGDVAKIVTALMTDNPTAAENAFSNLFHTSAKGDLGTMMLDVPKAIVKNVVHSFISHLSSLISGGGGKGVSGSVAGDATLAKEVLALLGQPIQDYVIVLAQEMTESGGNATIVNRTDSNWLAGTPSVGIMQVIGPTFAANAGPFRNVGPFEYGVSVNRMANMYAGMHYAVDRYGPAPGGWTDVLGHGHGYDHGGWWPSGTFGWNTSGRDEYVLTHDQVHSMGGTEYHAHFDGVTYQSHEAMTRRAFQQMEIGKGRLARIGRRQ